MLCPHQSCVRYSTFNCSTRYNTGTFVPDKVPGTFGQVLCTLYLPQVPGTMYLNQKYLVPGQVLCTWSGTFRYIARYFLQNSFFGQKMVFCLRGFMFLYQNHKFWAILMVSCSLMSHWPFSLYQYDLNLAKNFHNYPQLIVFVLNIKKWRQNTIFWRILGYFWVILKVFR